MTRVIIIATLIVVGLLLLPALFPGRVPPGELTRQRMAFDRVRILEYGRDHGQLPLDLSALPPLPQKPGTDHHLEDAWHRSLLYEVDASGTVTLTSLGKDGRPGGSGDNADIVFRFPSHTRDGSWVQADYQTYGSYVPPQQ